MFSLQKYVKPFFDFPNWNIPLIAVRKNICRSDERYARDTYGAALYDAAILKSKNRDYPHEGRLAFENRARRSGCIRRETFRHEICQIRQREVLVRFHTSRLGDWPSSALPPPMCV